MWITGGLCRTTPVSGASPNSNDAYRSGELLEGLTRSVLRASASRVVTVMQAAASRLRAGSLSGNGHLVDQP